MSSATPARPTFVPGSCARPLSSPGFGFAQLEVIQVAKVNGQLLVMLYVGRLINCRETGEMLFRAFHQEGQGGSFVGEIIDPRPVSCDGRTLIFQADIPISESGQTRQA